MNRNHQSNQRALKKLRQKALDKNPNEFYFHMINSKVHQDGRHFEKKEESDNYHRVERAYGSFTRSFTLPNTVSAEGANAEYKNGVLRVSLPKREETKARRIEVKGDEAPKTIEAKTEGSKAASARG